MTGHGDVHLAVRAMRAGALDFVEKPFNDQILLDLVKRAIRTDQGSTSARLKVDEIRSRVDVLTSRETEVLQGVFDGGFNKIIAGKLSLSGKTLNSIGQK